MRRGFLPVFAGAWARRSVPCAHGLQTPCQSRAQKISRHMAGLWVACEYAIEQKPRNYDQGDEADCPFAITLILFRDPASRDGLTARRRTRGQGDWTSTGLQKFAVRPVAPQTAPQTSSRCASHKSAKALSPDDHVLPAFWKDAKRLPAPDRRPGRRWAGERGLHPR